MCGRFAFTATPEELAEMGGYLKLHKWPEIKPRYNIAPTTQISVIRAKGDGAECIPMRWSLIPSWQKEGERPTILINARSETAATKPAFRSAFKKRRCIIPASGFFEWQTIGKQKYPHFIFLKGHHVMPFAGLWETWFGKDGSIESATILTTEANAVVGRIHDRMPCILRPDQFAAWLEVKDKTAEELMPMLAPYPDQEMDSYPVSQKVNGVKGGNEPELIERVPEPTMEGHQDVRPYPGRSPYPD